jgi:hypothetical protein
METAGKVLIFALIIKRLNGEPGGTRTRDHRIKSAMLYQLSYRPNGQLQEVSKLGAALGEVRIGFPTPYMTSLLAKV